MQVVIRLATALFKSIVCTISSNVNCNLHFDILSYMTLCSFTHAHIVKLMSTVPVHVLHYVLTLPLIFCKRDRSDDGSYPVIFVCCCCLVLTAFPERTAATHTCKSWLPVWLWLIKLSRPALRLIESLVFAPFSAENSMVTYYLSESLSAWGENWEFSMHTLSEFINSCLWEHSWA